MIRVHNILLPNKPLLNGELEKEYKTPKIPHYVGVFMRDTLPPQPQSKECGILNHDPLRGPGTHWTCWFKTTTTKMYFDSYGLPPPSEMVNCLKPKIHYNKDELQIRGTVVCGHFCVYVLKLMSEGQPYDEVVFSLVL